MSIRTWKGQISISLNEEYEDKIDRHKEEFKERSPTQEIYDRIDKIIENAPTPEERAELHRKKMEEHKKEVKKWQKKAKKKEARKELRSKKDDLQSVKQKIKEIKESGEKTEEQIRKESRNEILQECEEKASKPNVDKSAEELLEMDRYQRKIEKRIDSWKEEKRNIGRLQEKKQNLEADVQEYEEILEGE